jgi:hypothetical protein
MKDSIAAQVDSNRDPTDDPLQLRDKDPSNVVRFARASPHPDIERIHTRLTSGQYADATEVRLMLLAHLVYVAYRDIKETCNL